MSDFPTPVALSVEAPFPMLCILLACSRNGCIYFLASVLVLTWSGVLSLRLVSAVGIVASLLFMIPFDEQILDSGGYVDHLIQSLSLVW
jgi:hypothetical protein